MSRVAIIIAMLAARSLVLTAEPTTQPKEEHTVKPRSHIPREQLKQIFDGIRLQTKWNMDGEMLWGYFFVDREPERLKRLQQQLETTGYRFVDLHEVEKEGSKTGDFMLHVERVETHDVDSLDTRNGELDALAAEYGVREYDGMDVGPVITATPPAATRPAR